MGSNSAPRTFVSAWKNSDSVDFGDILKPYLRRVWIGATGEHTLRDVGGIFTHRIGCDFIGIAGCLFVSSPRFALESVSAIGECPVLSVRMLL